MKKLQLICFELFHEPQSRLGKWFHRALLTVIGLSMLTFVLETTALVREWRGTFETINTVVFVFFFLEYIGRLFVARRRIRYVFTPLALIDLLVLFSFGFHFFRLQKLQIMGVFRILQILKLIRYSDVMVAFFRTFRYYRDEIRIFGLTLLMVLILSSTGMYYLEGTLNPDFATIPDALWWAVVTVSTLGYGDIVPMTAAGRLLGSVVVFLGLGTVAILTALVTKVFIDHFFGKRMHHCEYCHFPHHDFDAKFCKNCGAKLDIQKLRNSEKLS